MLTDAVTYAPLKIDDLDHEVAVVLESAPSVWLADQTVNLKRYQQDIMFYASALPGGSSSFKPYEARKIEVEQAGLDASSAKKMMESLTRNLYYGVESLEQAYAGAQERLKLADENLHITKLNLTWVWLQHPTSQPLRRMRQMLSLLWSILSPSMPT